MQSTLATFFKPVMTSAHLIDCPALINKVSYILFSPSCSVKITLQYRTKYLLPLPILGGDILYFRRRDHNNLRAIITPFSPINKHVKGENSQKAKRCQKRAITQLRKKNTSNSPTKGSNKREKNKHTLPIPSKPSMKRNQHHIKHTIIQRRLIYRQYIKLYHSI